MKKIYNNDQLNIFGSAGFHENDIKHSNPSVTSLLKLSQLLLPVNNGRKVFRLFDDDTHQIPGYTDGDNVFPVTLVEVRTIITAIN